MSKQTEITRKLDKKLEFLLDQYANRVRANKEKNKPVATSDIFIELNNIWIRDCSLAKRPLQKEQFAVAVTNLNKLTLDVEKRIKFDYNLGRFLFWFVVFMLLLGTSVFFYCIYWLYVNHF